MNAPQTEIAVTRPATEADVPAVTRIFGRAFDDYQRGFGVDAATLGALWEESLAARVEATTVAVVPSPAEGAAETVVGFVITVRPGAKERYRRRRSTVRKGNASWWRVLGPLRMWRLPAFFLPMGMAYTRRRQAKDELYISLIAVDPDHQGRGIGRALLAAAEAEARAAGAVAVLLHTASTNATARAAYARAGYVLVCAVRAPWPGPAGIPVYLALRKPLGPEPATRIEALTR